MNNDSVTRLIPSWPFPSYIFMPGQNPHPKKEEGHMAGENDPVATRFLDPASSDTLRYALDLYNFGYFWESHVYFEALWNAYGRVGSEADFFKGIIKLGAAGLKLKLNQKHNADVHFLRAIALIEEVMISEGECFLGFDLPKIINDIKHSMANETSLTIYPNWE